MRITATIVLAGLFVFLAGFNVWNMLTSRGTSARSRAFWIQCHRAAGYAFIALFLILCYFMLLRLKGSSDTLAPQVVLHMGLALSLAPLLFAKVIVARYQKAARSLLTSLGISISAIAFTLVSLSVSVHYLRIASPHRVPAGASGTVIVVVLISAVALYRGRGRHPKRPPDTAAPPLNGSASPAAAGPSESVSLVLARIDSQADDAKTLRFLVPRGRRLAARPGQFLTFDWTIEGQTVTRSYSICSSPLQTGYIEITPKRVAHGRVSQFLNDRAEVGLTVTARGPYGRFCFDESKHKRIVLIAGGSGITPMIAMLRYIDDLCIPVDTALIYCVRTEQDVFFNDDLATFQGRLKRFRYVLVLSQPSSNWTGWKGRLRREILEHELEAPLESTFFLCGPPAFMEAGRALLKDMAIEPSRILQESFGGAVAGETHSTATPGSLEITLSRSGTACNVSPNDTVLEGLERNGVLIPSGCRQGSCGTCATRLLAGTVQMEHEDALSDELRAQGFILPCVSRPLSDLTLEA